MSKPETTDLHRGTVDVVAKATGLRPDQVDRAIHEYRLAVDQIEAEPPWEAIVHMSGPHQAIAQYGAPGTAITMQVESWKEREQWRECRYYVYGGRKFDHFAEARQAELAATARPKPYGIADGK